MVIGDLHVETWALIDSGFDGHLVIPTGLADRLPPPGGRRRIQTASGEVLAASAFVGTVDVLDEPGVIEVQVIVLGDEYLIGIEILNLFKVTLDHGEQVTVER